jgi:hypothetical protein
LSVRLSALPAVALAIVVAVAGCGGSGASGDTTTASISKAEFIKKADAICAKGGKQSLSEFLAFEKENKIPEGKEPTTAQWAEIGTKVLVPALQQQVDEIRRLGSPAGDEAQIEAFLHRGEEAVEKLEENPETAKSPSKVLADAHEVIKGYGFKVCGRGK